MTEGVIDALELVEIQEHDRDAVSVPPCPLQCSLDLLHQGSAVVQARQGVMVGSPQQFRLSLLALGDVLDRQDAAAGAHGAVEQGRAESRAAGCAHGGIRGTPVLALSDRIAEIGQGVIQAVGGHEQTFQGRFLDRVLRHCQHGLGHLVDIKNDTLPIHDDESRCGSVEDGSEPVALHGGRRLAGLLETVVQGLHLSGCQQEGPVMQVTLLLGLLIRCRHPLEQGLVPRVGDLFGRDAYARHLPAQCAMQVVGHAEISVSVVIVMVWLCNWHHPSTGDISP